MAMGFSFEKRFPINAPGASVYTCLGREMRCGFVEASKTCVCCVYHRGRSLAFEMRSLPLREAFVLPSEGGDVSLRFGIAEENDTS
jgi:hypothetical protein